MPLNIELPVESVENPELEEFKRTVVVAARKMAKRHGLCSVVDDTLEGIGLDPKLPEKSTQKVEVQLTIPVTAVLDMDIHGLAGLTPQQQNAKVAEAITATVTLKSNVTGDKRVSANSVTVLDLNEPPAPVPGERVVPAGYVGRFIGEDGRVMHLVDPNAFTTDWRGNGQWAYAMCSGAYVNNEQETSRRDEGRMCANCERVARGRGLL